ncbi:hypothetical protein ACFL0V_01340 [Nanoarchaeota archaeon]
MKAIRPVKRQVLSAEEALAEVEGVAGTEPMEGFAIQDRGDHYFLENCPHMGKKYDVSWSKEYLAGGEKMGWDAFMQLGGGWELAHMTFYTSTMMALFKESVNGGKSDVLDDVVKMFHDDFEDWIMTGSLVRVNGESGVVLGHDYHRKDVAVPKFTRGKLYECLAETIEGLFGERNAEYVAKAFESVTGSIPTLHKPIEDGDHPMVIGPEPITIIYINKKPIGRARGFKAGYKGNQ